MSTPRHGHAPIPMRKVTGYDEAKEIGDFWWEFSADPVRSLLWVNIPDCEGDPTPIHLPVSESRVPGVKWGWDGNTDKPTLTPSVHTLGHWHGWVRNGELVEA